MNPSLVTRSATPGRALSLIPNSYDNSTKVLAEARFGKFCRLLRPATRDKFLAAWPAHRNWKIQLRGHLADGEMFGWGFHDGILSWLLAEREPEAFLACLRMVGQEYITVDTNARAATLLEAVQQTAAVSGLKLKIVFTGGSNFEEEVIRPTAAALNVNNGINEVSISFSQAYNGDISRLTDALRLVSDLQIDVDCDSLTPAILLALTSLFTSNREIKSFSLRHQFFLQHELAEDYTAAICALLDAMKMQQRLESLDVAGVPQAGQEALGDVIANSRTVADLSISLHGDNCSSALAAALGQNSTIKTLCLHVVRLTDGMSPAIELFAGNKCRANCLTLETVAGRPAGWTGRTVRFRPNPPQCPAPHIQLDIQRPAMHRPRSVRLGAQQ